MKISRRDFLKIAQGSIIGCSIPSWAGAMGNVGNNHNKKRAPNILFILADDQGYGDFSCFGNKILKTPNMDKLYEQSTRLTSFYMSPVCAPTRACLMTGRYNYRTGVWDTWKGRCNMSTDEITIAEALSQAGYRTGIFGKWHLGYNYPMRPIDQGFQETFIFDFKSRFNPTMIHNGSKEKHPGFLDDVVFDKAIEFISKKSDKPFFACVTSIMPHTAPPDSTEPEVPQEYIAPFKSEPGLNDVAASIYGMVSKLDENVGRVMKRLKSLGLDENTVVIYTSDNGPQVGNAPRYKCGLRGGKGTVYEAGIKLPCFFRWPGVFESGKDVEQIGAHIDFMPTVLDICGVRVPDNLKIDGTSLLPLLKNKDAEWPERIIFGQFHRVDVPDLWTNSFAREPRYKLVNGTELYDIINDPYEKNNISDKHPKIVSRLRQAYENWFSQVTKQRGFKGGVAALGEGNHKIITFEDIDNVPSDGWQVKFVNDGPYMVSIGGIQNQLFDNGAVLCLDFNGIILKEPLDKNKKNIQFDNLKVKKGDGRLKIWFEGNKKPGVYGYIEDPGYRSVTITLKD